MNIKSSFRVFIFLLLTSTAFSQSNWEWITPYPTGFSIGSIAYSGHWIFLSGGGRKAFLSTSDFGNSFNDYSTFKYDGGHDYGIYEFGQKIAFIDSLNGFLISDKAYRTTNGGRDWSVISNVNYSGIVDFADNKTGWIVSEVSMNKTTNGGNNWLPINNFPANEYGRFTKFFSLDSLNIFFTTQNYFDTKGHIVKSTDGGETWFPTVTDLPADSAFRVSFFALHIRENGLGLATARIWNIDTFLDSSVLLQTNDFGNTWHTINSLPKAYYAKFLSISDSLWMLFGRETNDVYTLRTTDGGLTWNQISGYPNRIRNFTAAVYIEDYDLIFAASYRKISKSTDYGETFIPISGEKDINPYNIAVGKQDETGNIITVAYGDTSKFLISTNNGDDWELRTIPNEAGSKFEHMIVGIKNIYGASSNGLLYKSTDLGYTWIDITPQSGTYLLGAIGVYNDEAIAFQVIYSGYYNISFDAGETWNSVPVAWTMYSQTIFFVSPDDFYIGGYYYYDSTASGGFILNSKGDFNNYRMIFSGDNVRKIVFPNPEVVMALNRKGLTTTFDGGAHWNKYSGFADVSISDIYFVDENRGYLTVGNYVYSTQNGGRIWNGAGLELPDYYNISSIVVYPDGDYLLFYDFGVMLKYNANPGITSDTTDRYTLPPESFTLYQNYPNPFNPSTKIKYAVNTRNANQAFVNLTVFNSLGQTVEVLVNEVKQNGVYEVDFNGGGLASGVYFYRLTVNGNFQSKKMLLLK